MIGNLRGVRESGTIFMAPTYLYIAAILAMVGVGLARMASGTLPEYTPPADWLTGEGPGQALGIFLILRAFSSGAAALTGVEAISDGVPAFKPPEWRNARITLVWAAAIFAALFLGISFMASTLGIVPDPSEEQTVLSLIARLLVGDGAFFVVIQVATVLVLALAANTAFADFPRLSSFLARDSFMPRQFAFRGERLAFTTGIVALSGLAILLLVVFDASVSALIPLYTLGVFLAFTLSQSSMVVRWWRRREEGWRRGLVINGVGALTTGVIALIVVESKFLSGAWIVVIAIPAIVMLMLAIRGPLSVGGGAAAPCPHSPRRTIRGAADRGRADCPPRRAGAPGTRLRELDLEGGHCGPCHERRRWRCGPAEPVARVGRRRGARCHRVPVPGAHRSTAGLPRRPPAARLDPTGARRPLGVRPTPLVGEPASQPDGAPAQAPPVCAAKHHRRRRAIPPRPRGGPERRQARDPVTNLSLATSWS